MGETTLNQRLVFAALALFACASGATAQVLPRGTIIDQVQCAGDPAQTYALYLPSAYSPERKWNLLLAFHPAARGRLMVEKYQAAAEQYGYIIAASNNSRNGAYALSIAAALAVGRDVGLRFSVDAQRVYLAGMSGGARVAMMMGLSGNNVAGVIASSAGYLDSQPRANVSFAVFSTAGTEDFNYLEMRLLDRKLSSPHFLAVFQGGHTLPPDSVALDAIEWMELRAVQSRRRIGDDALVGAILAKRRAGIAAATGPAETVYLLQALVSDFKGLHDVSAEASRLEQMSRQSEVKKALKPQREADDAEGRAMGEVFELEVQLGEAGRRNLALITLRDRLAKLSRTAAGEVDTSERGQARRVLRSIAAGASTRVQDREYLALLAQYRPEGR